MQKNNPVSIWISGRKTTQYLTFANLGMYYLYLIL